MWPHGGGMQSSVGCVSHLYTLVFIILIRSSFTASLQPQRRALPHSRESVVEMNNNKNTTEAMLAGCKGVFSKTSYISIGNEK